MRMQHHRGGADGEKELLSQRYLFILAGPTLKLLLQLGRHAQVMGIPDANQGLLPRQPLATRPKFQMMKVPVRPSIDKYRKNRCREKKYAGRDTEGNLAV